jgi:hypothetical protein
LVAVEEEEEEVVAEVVAEVEQAVAPVVMGLTRRGLRAHRSRVMERRSRVMGLRGVEGCS